MSWGRYMLLRFAVSFALFVLSVLPTFYVMGFVASQMPRASAPVAFGFVGLVWLLTMTFGSHLITEKLSKRWSN